MPEIKHMDNFDIAIANRANILLKETSLKPSQDGSNPYMYRLNSVAKRLAQEFCITFDEALRYATKSY